MQAARWRYMRTGQRPQYGPCSQFYHDTFINRIGHRRGLSKHGLAFSGAIARYLCICSVISGLAPCDILNGVIAPHKSGTVGTDDEFWNGGGDEWCRIDGTESWHDNHQACGVCCCWYMMTSLGARGRHCDTIIAGLLSGMITTWRHVVNCMRWPWRLCCHSFYNIYYP